MGMPRGDPKLSFFRPFRQFEEAYPADWLAELRQKLMANPLLSASTLNARFAGTLGFSVAFRREGLEQVEAHFPEFSLYLRDVLHPRGNAFFLNPLVIYEGGHVAPHVDRSLKSWTVPDMPPYPLKVSVLYVDVPSGLAGGQLILHRYRPLATIQPKTNLLFQFQGKLRHEVTEVDRREIKDPRISLVCEHYRLPPEQLERVPVFHVRTKRPFEDFLNTALGGQTQEARSIDSTLPSVSS